MEIYNWFVANWDEIVALYGALVVVASLAVKFTPTLKDDDFLLKVVKFLSKYIALNRTENDEEIRKLRQ